MSLSSQKNTLVLGYTGSGKTQYFVKENLKQMKDSYVVTDVNRMLLSEMKEDFVKNGYKIKILDLSGKAKVDGYNPLLYCKTEEDARCLARILLHDPVLKADVFFINSVLNLLTACICILSIVPNGSEVPYASMKEIMGDDILDPTLYSLPELVKLSCTEKFDEIISKIIEYELSVQPGKKENEVIPSFISMDVAVFQNNSKNTKESVAISAAATVEFLNNDFCKELLKADDLDLERLSKEKTVLFVEISPVDKGIKPYVFAKMLYSQIQSILDNSDHQSGNIHVRMIMDEYMNICPGAPFFNNVSENRGCGNYSIAFIIQTIVQLTENYSSHLLNICKNVVWFSSPYIDDDRKFMEELIGGTFLYEMFPNKNTACVSHINKEKRTAEKINCEALFS